MRQNQIVMALSYSTELQEREKGKEKDKSSSHTACHKM
jgi:hypothetical protein